MKQPMWNYILAFAPLLIIGPVHANESAVGVPDNLVAEGWTPLLWATYLGREAEALDLVGAGADVEAKNQEGWNALFVAATRGQAALFEMYVEAATQLDDRDPDGNTVLHHAAALGLSSLAEVLIEKGADTNARRNDQLTALHLAAAHDHADLCAALIAHGAEVNAGSPLGAPLHMAAYGGHGHTVRVLLASDARTDSVDGEGNTPLHDAMSQGHLEIADLLIAAGADRDALNHAGNKTRIPPDKLPVRFDHADQEAVRALAAETEWYFQRSIEARDMTHFYSVIAQAWRDHNSLSEINATYNTLFGLKPEERYWAEQDFVLEGPAAIDENGFLRVVVRYPGLREHTFVEQVYVPESGAWKPGGYHLYERVYNETWEEYNRAVIAHAREGRHDEAVEWANRALRFASGLTLPEPELVILSAQTLARIQISQFDFDAAIAPRLLAVSLLEKLHGTTHPLVADEVEQLYMAYVMSGRKAEEDLANAWNRDIRIAADGDADAAQRLDRREHLNALWETVPTD